MYPNLFHLPDWFPIGGGAAITSFGVMLFAASLTGGYVLKTEMVRQGQTAEQAWDLLITAVIGGIVGARLYYVLFNYDRLAADPMGMIFSAGGMTWYGGFLLAVLLVFWRIHKDELPLGKTFDAIAPGLAIAYAVGRIGCFLVGDDYGRPTSSWVGIAFPNGNPPSTATNLNAQFGVEIDPAMVEQYGEVLPVHPTQLYETGISSLIFVILWSLRRHVHRPGWLFALWLVLASMERFFVEIFRAKHDRFFAVLTTAQLISLILAGVGVAWMLKLRKAN